MLKSAERPAAVEHPPPPAVEAVERLGSRFSSRSRLLIEELFLNLPGYFQPERAGGLRVTVECRIGYGSRSTERYQIVIGGGRCTVDKDGAAASEVTLHADWLDFLRLALGDVTASKLFLHGRLKFTGNVLLASRLRGFFAMPSDATATAA